MPLSNCSLLRRTKHLAELACLLRRCEGRFWLLAETPHDGRHESASRDTESPVDEVHARQSVAVVDSAVEHAHVEDWDNSCGGKQAELRRCQGVISADRGETDCHGGCEAQGLNDIFSKKRYPKGERTSRQQ